MKNKARKEAPPPYNSTEMKKIKFQEFDSHEEADRASRLFYSSLSNDERIKLALKLMQPYYEAAPRFQRIFRTSDLGECPVSTDWRVGLQSVCRTENDG